MIFIPGDYRTEAIENLEAAIEQAAHGLILDFPFPEEFEDALRELALHPSAEAATRARTIGIDAISRASADGPFA